jgi:hypothetical protein
MGRRLWILVAVLGLFLGAACTGAPRPSDVAAGKGDAPDGSRVLGTTADDPGTTVAGQAVDAAGNPIAGRGAGGRVGSTASGPGGPAASWPVPGV